jgi:SNF2 family DNA or RNA helicase
VVVPGLFGTHTNFLNEFCITRMQTLPGTRRQVPVITGYRQRDIALFRERIDPYFLGRPKFEVARELPPLVVRHVKCEMTRFQAEKYKEALSGLLEVGVRTETDARMAEEREVSKLTAVSYCQQIVNHPELIGCEGDSDKLDTLLDTLTEGELADEKVIVFTRFSKMVDLLMPILAKAKIKAVRITGAEDEKKRKAAQDAFQDSKGDTRVIVITTAASEAINLQAAKALIFYDTPWSAGEYLQIIGRMIRIGSTHDRCFALHLVCTGTIDVRVTQVLAKKMDLVEQVLGRRLKGEDDDVVVNSSDDLTDLFEGLMEDARAASKS